MSIVIEKQSKCPLCNKFLDESKEYMLTPPLISNIKDDLFILSDAGIHTNCINQSNLKNKIYKHMDLYHKRFPLSEAVCIIDGKRILNPKNILSFGLLTSNESEELYLFNYLTLNIRNIKKWNDYNKFVSVAEKFLFEEKWEALSDFNYLQYIIDKVKIFRLNNPIEQDRNFG